MPSPTPSATPYPTPSPTPSPTPGPTPMYVVGISVTSTEDFGSLLVTASGLMSSVPYKKAKSDGLADALSVDAPLITITGIDIVGNPRFSTSASQASSWARCL